MTTAEEKYGKLVTDEGRVIKGGSAVTEDVIREEGNKKKTRTNRKMLGQVDRNNGDNVVRIYRTLVQVIVTLWWFITK